MAHAQKALVYCPVGIDATGCNTIVAALTANTVLFPDGVDAAYDGTSGTVDLAGADLSAYGVFVVPSLADGPDVQPYALLRDGTVAGRLKAAFMGRVAVWSGTPDVGSTNRSAKDNLLRNLAAWAKPDSAGTHGPGVVALQDNSDDAAGRYGWLSGISQMSVTADNTLDVYSNVQVLTTTGQTILTGSGGLQIGYSNMASFGLVVGNGASSDATGGRSTRVVLVTMAGEPSDPTLATVSTDKDDYQPGDTITVTGAGWEAGETVSLTFHEEADPPIHPDKTLTTVADADGHIFSHEYEVEETDLGVRFTLTATGQTSGKTAQATFTDNRVITAATVNGGSTTTVPAGSPITASVTVNATTSGGGGENWFSTAWRYATTPPGTTTCEDGTPDFTGTGNETATFTTTAPIAPGTYNAYFIAFRTANCGNNASNTFVLTNAVVVTPAPDLTINKSHTGNFTVATPASYALTVTNSGSAATSGTVTVTDAQPAGLTFTGASGTGWSCSGTTTISCTRSNSLAVGASYPDITVNVTPTAAGTVTNTASVSGGGEANTTNDTDSDPTTVNDVPDLTIDKSHSGNFNVGVNGTYSITVTNGGGVATTAPLTVTDVLPASLGFVSATGGGTWSCGFASGTVTCTRANSLGAGNTTPAITLVVSVSAAAVPSVTNTASVSGGGEPAANNGNNSDSDPTTVGIGVDLTIDKSHAGNFTQGVNETYSLTVSNPGTVVTSATITVTDNLPTGLGFVSGTGTGWNACTVSVQVVTCVRPAANTIAAGGAAPAITLTVTVAAAAIPSVTNTASVAGGGEPAANNGNNSDSDPTTVTAGVDLTIDKSHTGNFTEGINGTYSLTVSNGGGTATSANVTVTDVLPTGLGFVSGTGTGWNNCTVATQTVTCVRLAANTIAAGGAAPAITLTVTVAAAAIPSVTNTASVAGGGEPAANNGNNSDSDPTTVIAANQPPVVDAGGPYTGDEGAAIPLNTATATDPDAGDTPTYKWTYAANGAVDAGTTCGFSNDAIVQPTFTCNDDGAFTVTLTVNDGHGHIVPDDAAVTVNNVKPTATAGGPYSGNENSAIQLGGSGDDPAANDDDPKLTYKWTVNAAGIDAGGACTFDDDTKKDAKVTCTDDGAFTVTLVATDDDGAASTGSAANLTVSNVNPVADAGGPYSGNEGAAIPLNGSATDVSPNDVLTYKWTADVTGIDAGGACTFDDDTKKDAKVTCTDDGGFKVKLTATDDDGGSHFEEVALTGGQRGPGGERRRPLQRQRGRRDPAQRLGDRRREQRHARVVVAVRGGARRGRRRDLQLRRRDRRGSEDHLHRRRTGEADPDRARRQQRRRDRRGDADPGQRGPGGPRRRALQRRRRLGHSAGRLGHRRGHQRPDRLQVDRGLQRARRGRHLLVRRRHQGEREAHLHRRRPGPGDPDRD